MNLDIFREVKLEDESPPPLKGIEFSKSGGHYSTKELDKQKERKEWYNPSTIILGVNPESPGDDKWNGGWAEWTFKTDPKVLKSLTSAYLRITTIRAQGELHSTKEGDKRGYRKRGGVFINEIRIDILYLVKSTERGEAYGISKVGPYPIIDYIDKEKSEQIVKLQVDPTVAWNIDEVCLELIVKRMPLKSWVWEIIGMIIGALISALIGAHLSSVGQGNLSGIVSRAAFLISP